MSSLTAHPRRWWPRPAFIAILLAVYTIWFAAINILGSQQSLQNTDFIVVPGARVDSDGRPGLSLQSRLDRAAELYRQGWAKMIFCTGGRGDSGAVEAEAARDYLMLQGVPAEAFRLEAMSHTTWENFYFASQELQGDSARSCLVVTDPFHMQRCLWIASEVGLKPYPAPSFEGPGWKPRGMLFYTSREMAAWVKYAAQRAGRAL